jgi:hypothetical protein
MEDVWAECDGAFVQGEMGQPACVMVGVSLIPIHLNSLQSIVTKYEKHVIVTLDTIVLLAMATTRKELDAPRILITNFSQSTRP